MGDALHVFCTLSTSTLFTSVNAGFLPEPPIVTDECHSIYDALRPRWAYDNYFYFAFVPMQPKYHGSILYCLSPLVTQIEAVQGKRGSTWYHLKPVLQKQWMVLEQTIHEVLTRLIRRVQYTYLEMAVTPAPHMFGYASDWPSAKAAELHAKLARTAFTLRLALISYLVFKESINNKRVWEELCQGDNPISVTVCNAFQASWISDWTIPRIGAFVDITTICQPQGGHQWHCDIPHILRSGIRVPLWFAYPDHPIPLARMVPDTMNLCRQFACDHRWRSILQEAVTSLYTTDNNSLTGRGPVDWYYGSLVLRKGGESLPDTVIAHRRHGSSVRYLWRIRENRVELRALQEPATSHSEICSKALRFNYRQRPGETYDQFMRRTLEECTALELTESEDDTTERQSRVEKHSSQPIPGKDGPAVFVWQLEHDMQVRKSVRHQHIEYLWRRTTPQQRTYNPYRHEYDVYDITMDESIAESVDTNANNKVEANNAARSTHPRGRRSRSASPLPRPQHTTRARSPAVQNQKETDKYDVFRNTSAFKKIPIRDLTSTNEHAAYRESDINILVDRDNDDALINEAVVPVRTEAVSHVLAMRYGYTRPPNSWKASHPQAIHWISSDLPQMYRCIGAWTRNDSVERDSLDSVADFVATIASGNTPPADIFDLHPDAPIRSPSIRGGSYVAAQACRVRSDIWYKVTHTQERSMRKAKWCLLVKHATTVLQARREQFGPTITHFLVALIARGIPSKILAQGSPDTMAPIQASLGTGDRLLDGRPLGIGIKPYSISLSTVDYKAYVYMRDELLSGYRGRVALLQGGIVWRLAWSVSKLSDAIQGPAVDDPDTWNSQHKIMIDGTQYVDIPLTLQDIYVICGTYRVLNQNNTNQASIVSWWPLDDTWNEGRLNVGHWSQEAELWFQNRLEIIKGGTAQPLSQKEWKKTLRRGKETTAFHSNIEALSVSAL